MISNNLFSLKGKTALVTGGSTGIGLMATAGLASAGAKTFIVSRKLKNCQNAAKELNSFGFEGEVIPFSGDLSSENGINTISDEISSKNSGLNILINNAGRTWGSDFSSFPYDAWAKVLNLNVSATFYLTQKLVPLLTASSKSDFPSRVVNIGSVMGEVPMGDGAYSYAASKSAVHHITKILAKELAEKNVTVNALSPGPFQSNMTDFALGDSKGTTRVSKRVPLNRVGQTDDIAAAIQFLCGKGGSYVTGAILPVSGGINVSTGPSIFGDD
jgi:NAD(P)-dependent dehydrogenase (short-subunit alcohol dehydrogenase family)